MPKAFTLNDYQGHTQATAPTNVSMAHPATFAVMGLTEEAGEVMRLHRQMCRDNAGMMTEADRHDMELELGDVLWNVAQIALRYDLTLYGIMLANMDKMAARHLPARQNGSQA